MEDYLSHHGILGMKWGKQNGPPYPLDKSDYSRLEKIKNGIKAGRTAVKNYSIKRKRKASLEKARSAKAEKKKQEEARAKKEEKARKKEEAYNTFINTADKINNTTLAIQKYADSYNRIAKLANPFISSKYDTTLPILGEKIKSKTDSFIEDLIRSADAESIWANRGKLDNKQLKDAIDRLGKEKDLWSKVEKQREEKNKR